MHVDSISLVTLLRCHPPLTFWPVPEVLQLQALQAGAAGDAVQRLKREESRKVCMHVGKAWMWVWVGQVAACMSEPLD
jgi:hypothetical protein